MTEIKIQNAGRTTVLHIFKNTNLAIKDDQCLQNKVIKPWSVHRVYFNGNEWKLSNFIQAFDQFADAKDFIQKQTKNHIIKGETA